MSFFLSGKGKGGERKGYLCNSERGAFVARGC